MNKKAYSLVEVLIMLSIISLLAILGLKTLTNNTNQYGQAYYNAYNSLKKTAYNVLADMHCPDTNSEDALCRIGARPFPKEVSNYRINAQNTKGLCNRFAEFLNVVESRCNNNFINDATGEITEANSPNLVLSNSYKLYFGNKMHEYKINDERKIEYFVVYMDLNGDKRPNTTICQSANTKPDIVPFAITRRGEVIPMGFPIFQKGYITAQVSFPTEYNGEGASNVYSDSMSFYEAAAIAWPTSSGSDIVESHADIPFSLMFTQHDDFANSAIRQCYNGTVADLKTFKNYKDQAEELRKKYIKEERGAQDCSGGKFNCRVTIESNTTTRY